jgi:hypothetical protein
MNYTTLAKVKAALGAETAADDALLQVKITEASRAIDRLCSAPDNYFMREFIAAQLLDGIAARNGVVICFPPKSAVNSVTSFEYRFTPRESWQSVATDYLTIHPLQVSAYAEETKAGKCQVRLSYNGGYGAESGSPAVITGLPEDIINAATVLAVRFYKEEKTGLSDAIGVADLGVMQYTKAFPVRVVEMMKPYKRIL